MADTNALRRAWANRDERVVVTVALCHHGNSRTLVRFGRAGCIGWGRRERVTSNGDGDGVASRGVIGHRPLDLHALQEGGPFDHG
jgi:hypothetical protein